MGDVILDSLATPFLPMLGFQKLPHFGFSKRCPLFVSINPLLQFRGCCKIVATNVVPRFEGFLKLPIFEPLKTFVDAGLVHRNDVGRI